MWISYESFLFERTETFLTWPDRTQVKRKEPTGKDNFSATRFSIFVRCPDGFRSCSSVRTVQNREAYPLNSPSVSRVTYWIDKQNHSPLEVFLDGYLAVPDL
uniref:Uncharacterized protein n=1 Tax=Anopheles minimus TaxID=112268 RepID=A0A182WPH6_9DIPT